MLDAQWHRLSGFVGGLDDAVQEAVLHRLFRVLPGLKRRETPSLLSHWASNIFKESKDLLGGRTAPERPPPGDRPKAVAREGTERGLYYYPHESSHGAQIWARAGAAGARRPSGGEEGEAVRRGRCGGWSASSAGKEQRGPERLVDRVAGMARAVRPFARQRAGKQAPP